MAATDFSRSTRPIPTAGQGAVLGRAENRVIWLLLGAAFVAILNETTMSVPRENRLMAAI